MFSIYRKYSIESKNISKIFYLNCWNVWWSHVWFLLVNDGRGEKKNIYAASREDGRGTPDEPEGPEVPTRKRQSESLNDVSSNGSFHDEGAHLPALLSNFDNFISREKTPRYGSRSRKSPVNPIVAGELGPPKAS